ncbi:hypothetical protein ETD83_02295 [Actinomadura soli]|uniref:Uncharacterized protein n=1 Tax=Actinomadura soli TaxID=2508997 RepID=A0A5C4JJK4_9ACTN|nr:hypothetical protein [Actinomadura soli]TMR06992.1 hypothetical protein ETD83_02295 [Actinomadura soli]
MSAASMDSEPAASVELTTAGGKLPMSKAAYVATIRLALPTAYPLTEQEGRVDPSVLGGHELVGLRVAFEVVEKRRPVIIAVYLRTSFEDDRVMVLDLETASPRQSAEAPEVTVSFDGLSTAAAGTQFESERGVHGGHMVLAVLAVPADLPDLRGSLRADATVRQNRWSIAHVSAGEPQPFVASLPPGRSGPRPNVSHDVGMAVPSRPWAAGPGARSQTKSGVRLCLAADIERFSRLRLTEAIRAQRRFVDLLARARHNAGVDVPDNQVQASGDGQFVVLPPDIDETVVIPRLVTELRKALVESNIDLSEHARLRIRVSLHRGHVSNGANGWVGDSTIAVHRLLDSTPLPDTRRAPGLGLRADRSRRSLQGRHPALRGRTGRRVVSAHGGDDPREGLHRTRLDSRTPAGQRSASGAVARVRRARGRSDRRVIRRQRAEGTRRHKSRARLPGNRSSAQAICWSSLRWSTNVRHSTTRPPSGQAPLADR